jgi:hypothetical protein
MAAAAASAASASEDGDGGSSELRQRRLRMHENASPNSLRVDATRQPHHSRQPSSPDAGAGGGPERSGGKARGAGDESLSFTSFLFSELNIKQTVETDFEEQTQRVRNFVDLPKQLESFLLFGFGVCMDQFLFLVTFLPFRIASALLGRISRWVRLDFRAGFNKREKRDMLQGVALLAGFAALSLLDVSRTYHFIRGQSVLKLYVLFNILQMLDRMCASFGEDTIDALFGSVRLSPLRVLFHVVVASIYTALHSMVHLMAMITMNVSVNSNKSNLFVLLVSSNFVELKSSVFKRFKPEVRICAPACAQTRAERAEPCGS